MPVTIYGIRNCDTMKKAFVWLEQHQIDYTFHDYKKQGISEETLCNWLQQLDWETLVNRRGTTWRKLPDDVKSSMDKESAIREMINNPSLIKRPVLEVDGTIIVGFSEEQYQAQAA
jgi:arsenate reductase